jgi:exodeoxyribonuclease VII small subunit
VATAKPEKFEASLQRLEDLVQKLEDGDLPLEDSLKVFEEGMALVKTCERRLNEAQKKVEILMKDGKTKDFEVEE